jgi:hypothetical protein
MAHFDLQFEIQKGALLEIDRTKELHKVER